MKDDDEDEDAGSQEVTEGTEGDMKGFPKAVSALRSATAVQKLWTELTEFTEGVHRREGTDAEAV